MLAVAFSSLSDSVLYDFVHPAQSEGSITPR